MKHLGDITKINGAEIEPVDVITAGSPCQDLSIAGKRDGLKGERSGLFMEFIRIVKEMRTATNGVYPTFVIWENVPGAFSSNKGEDFRCVLEEICKIKESDTVIPRPPRGKWADAGEILGDGYSVAWRVLNAEFWGVPQRRRRIALVADFGGQRAAEILFECKSVSWNPAESGTAGQGTSVDSKAGIRAASGFNGRAGAGAGSIAFCEERTPALKAEQETHVLCCGFNGHKSITGSIQYAEEKAPTLESNMPSNVLCCYGIDSEMNATPEKIGTLRAHCSGGAEQAVVFENHAQDSRITGPLDVSPTCSAKWGMGGNNTPIVCEPKPPFTYDCRNHKADTVSATLQAKDGGGHSLNYINPVVTYSRQRSDEYKESEQASTISARDYKSATDLILENWIARRLMPIECERLQGMPDKWTDIPDYIDTKGKKKKVSDSARYKALGNSIARPPWYFVLSRLPGVKTLGSLFDGIGGFPLIWEQLHGKGSARWASEIEDFPIAVTKYHFGED